MSSVFSIPLHTLFCLNLVLILHVHCLKFDKTSKYLEYIPTLIPLHDYEVLTEMTFMNKTMAYKLYIMISSKHHLNWSANKIKMYSNKNINLGYFLANIDRPVYLRISLYTKQRYRSGYLFHDGSAFGHDSTGHRQWTSSLGGIPGRLSADLRGSHLHITWRNFFFYMISNIFTFNENYSSPMKNTHSFSFLSPKKFNQVLE